MTTFPKPLSYVEREARRLAWIFFQTEVLLAFAGTGCVTNVMLFLGPNGYLILRSKVFLASQ